MSVTIAGVSSRTVFPEEAFDKVNYTFKKDGVEKTVEEESSGTFVLETGNDWTVTVEGYKSNILVAQGTSGTFTVSQSVSTPVQVKLYIVESAIGEGAGTLVIDIEKPANTSITLLLLENLFDGDDPEVVEDDNANIPAGIYLLTVKLKDDNSEKTAGVSEVVYIYPSMTTTFTKIFTTLHFTTDGFQPVFAVSGKFESLNGPAQFMVATDGPPRTVTIPNSRSVLNARSASNSLSLATTVYDMSGVLEDGDVIFNLKGTYDSATGNYTMSAAASFVRYTINGGNNGATATLAVNVPGQGWLSFIVSVDTNESVDIPDTAEPPDEAPVEGLPESMWGSWEDAWTYYADNPDYNSFTTSAYFNQWYYESYTNSIYQGNADFSAIKYTIIEYEELEDGVYDVIFTYPRYNATDEQKKVAAEEFLEYVDIKNAEFWPLDYAPWDNEAAFGHWNTDYSVFTSTYDTEIWWYICDKPAHAKYGEVIFINWDLFAEKVNSKPIAGDFWAIVNDPEDTNKKGSIETFFEDNNIAHSYYYGAWDSSGTRIYDYWPPAEYYETFWDKTYYFIQRDGKVAFSGWDRYADKLQRWYSEDYYNIYVSQYVEPETWFTRAKLYMDGDEFVFQYYGENENGDSEGASVVTQEMIDNGYYGVPSCTTMSLETIQSLTFNEDYWHYSKLYMRQRSAPRYNHLEGGAPPPPPSLPVNITGNLGNYSWGENNGPVYTQARWELSSANVTLAKTPGTKLVLQLSNVPASALHLVWQGPTNAIAGNTSLWWKQAEILNDTGGIINGSSTTWDASSKTLTINLSAAADYAAFITQPDLNLIIAYYGGDSVNALGITSANLNLATFTVSFNSNGGSSVNQITGVASGSTISAPAAPTRTGYSFAGWYKEEELTNAWTFATDTVTANTTLYAKWTLDTGTATITYIWNDGIDDNTIASTTDNITFVPGSGTFARVLINGQIVAADTSSYTFSSAGKGAGNYTITFMVKDSSNAYNKNYTVTVE
uniref:Glycoside hydrolase family 5 n=1 Tax=uncultured bacterium contig00061 TaxID=1181544 RepID=A0A806JYV6_9BACT|nr:glycoside hydrolase family 5 [uncultured bacterium contig00061]